MNCSENCLRWFALDYQLQIFQQSWILKELLEITIGSQHDCSEYKYKKPSHESEVILFSKLRKYSTFLYK